MLKLKIIILCLVISNSLIAQTKAKIGNNIQCIFQDKNNNYWFGTFGEGVYCYNGETVVLYTVSDGLCNNQIEAIQEDNSGNIWFSTGSGISKFDGQSFTTFTNQYLYTTKNVEGELNLASDDLWIHSGGEVYRYHDETFTHLILGKTILDKPYLESKENLMSPYFVYCILKDDGGNLWFGTHVLGVCKYDGKSFVWFTDKGISGAAVRGLWEDKKGNIWMGNNGAGLFSFDGTILTNFTEKKGLSNDDFLKTSKVTNKLGTLARIFSITEDNIGNLWIGTIDAGLWRYDGVKLINYTTSNGLPSNTVNTTYIDNKGELWVGTNGEGVYKFNGFLFSRAL